MSMNKFAVAAGAVVVVGVAAWAIFKNKKSAPAKVAQKPASAAKAAEKAQELQIPSVEYRLFNQSFSQLVEEPFNSEWANATGYFNGAMEGEVAPNLPCGKAFRFIGNGGRKAIVVGAEFGNIVIFQRYTNDTQVLIAQMLSSVAKLHEMASVGQLSADDLSKLMLAYKF